MKETKYGKYNYFKESLFVVDEKNNDAYELVSHVYIMDDGRSFTEYEKIKSEKANFLKEMEFGKND